MSDEQRRALNQRFLTSQFIAFQAIIREIVADS